MINQVSVGAGLHEKAKTGNLTGGDVAIGMVNIIAMALPAAGTLNKLAKTAKLTKGLAGLESKAFNNLQKYALVTDAGLNTLLLTNDFISSYDKLADIKDEKERAAQKQQLIYTSLLYGLLVVRGVKAVELVQALSKVGGSKAVSGFLGWGNKTTILKSPTDFTKDQLINAGYTKQVLTDIHSGLIEAAKKTIKSTGDLNPASLARAEQIEEILKTHFK
jgi:hypothetical protein